MRKLGKYLLKDIAVSQTGPFGSQLHEKDYVKNGTPIVTVEHLGEIGFVLDNLPLVSDEDKARLSKYTLKEGDIVFSRVGSVDRCTYVSKKEDGWLFSGRCLRVRFNEKADAKSSGGKMVWNEELKREIPEVWKDGLFSDIGNIMGGSTPSKDIHDYFSTNGTASKDLSLNGDNKFITKGELDVSEKGIKAASLKIMPKGTVLLSTRAPIGYMSIARGSVTTNQGFKSFIPQIGYSTPFIFYTIKNALPEIINNASGSTFKEISCSRYWLIFHHKRYVKEGSQSSRETVSSLAVLGVPS